jgi:CDP-diacylglycerol pyrophosphatase
MFSQLDGHFSQGQGHPLIRLATEDWLVVLLTMLSAGTNQVSYGRSLTVFLALAFMAAICTCFTFLLLAANSAQGDLPRTALWGVVHNLCVPGESQHHDPKPFLQVDLHGGIESGFAILRAPREGIKFLLIPTTQISGIESPIVRGPNATNYFASAWEHRTYIEEALHQSLPRDEIALAINSLVSRSQDQLHIHFSCVRVDVWEALHKYERRIRNHWALFNVSFFGHTYAAMWVSGEHLSPHNPFDLLENKLPGASQDMDNRTLVVIGFTRAEGAKGFVILADRANQEEESDDLGNGEELLDPSCDIAAMGNRAPGSLKGLGTE